MEVIVVDNNSPDGSADRLKRAFPEESDASVFVISNEKNMGFSAANNQAAEIARGDVFFFLNPDTVVHDHAIEHLFQFISNTPEAGAVGPLVLNTDGSVQDSTSRFPSLMTQLCHHLALPCRGKRDKDNSSTRVVDIVNGCALAVGRDQFEKVDGWDTSYFMYAEERELCLALKNAGYRNYFLPVATITHFGGQSTKEAYASHMLQQQYSSVAYLRRHHSGALVFANRIIGFLGYLLRDVVFGLRLLYGKDTSIQRRRQAATKLWRWFLLSYKSSDRAS